MRQAAAQLSLITLFVFIIAALKGAFVFGQFHPGFQVHGGNFPGDLLEPGDWGPNETPFDEDHLSNASPYFRDDGTLHGAALTHRFSVFASHCTKGLNGDPNHGAVTDLKCVVQAFRAEHYYTQSGGKLQTINSPQLVQIKTRLAIQTMGTNTYKKEYFDGYLSRFLRIYINALRGQNRQADNLSSWRKLRRDIQSHIGKSHPDITRLNVLNMIVADAIRAVDNGSLQQLLGVIDSIYGEFYLRQELHQQPYSNSM